jgi:serine/threonine protein kinase
VKRLGHGSFGVVYQATSLETQEDVAVKLVKDPFRTQYEARMIYREIKIMRKLQEID